LSGTHIGEIGRIASKEVTLQLINSECMPVLLYGLECYSVAMHDIISLDFAVARHLMKLFKSTNINVVDECTSLFHFMLSSEKIEK